MSYQVKALDRSAFSGGRERRLIDAAIDGQGIALARTMLAANGSAIPNGAAA